MNDFLKYWRLVGLLLLFPLAGWGQVVYDDEDEEEDEEYEYAHSTAENIDFLVEIDSLFSRVMRTYSDSMRRAMNDTISELLQRYLMQDGSFESSFGGVRYIGKISSSDGHVNIYTWNMLLNDGFLFNGFVQTADGILQKLQQAEAPYLPDIRRTISPKQWYGALYYDIVPYKFKGDTYYMLLGWGRYRFNTQYKVIDVLNVNGGMVEFGMPLFYDKQDHYHRIVLESDREASVSLVYDAKRKRFVFDHLSPMRSNGQRVISFGPDMSVDSYVRKRNGWELKEDVNVKNSK